MPVRLAACEPCRASKVACDHVRPVCTRCQEARRPEQCTYRDRPFKRQRVEPRKQQRSPVRAPEVVETISPSYPGTAGRHYPNPGYLGRSSHAAIFEQLPLAHGHGHASVAHPASSRNGSPNQFGDADVVDAASLLERISSTVSITSCIKLLDAWTSGGVNLALAGQFTMPCARAAVNLLEGVTDFSTISRNLFVKTCRPLKPHLATDLDEFISLNCSDEPRWEAIGMFFTAVSRAMTDMSCFRPLYDSRQERRNLQQRVMLFADRCLEICLSLDCLNDLQLMLQYENFIAHSFVDGDTSYHTWRRLGDVISTIFALGYHEHIGSDAETPEFLKRLRVAAFARTYSADKNVPIFLGRPPRMHRNFCRITVGDVENGKQPGGHHWQLSTLPQNTFDYMTETIWGCTCAWLKERVLDLRREPDDEVRLRLAAAVKAEADAQWHALPSRFRLDSPLRLCDCPPTERDFTVSARLNFLHVLFLVQISLVQRLLSPDPELINISAAMLSLEVEALILKDHLAFSGTSIGWRVAYYGLPAAGMLCLALLHKPSTIERAGVPLSKVKQDLRILISYVEMGALVHQDEPNFALLNGATETIKNLLENLPQPQFSSDTGGNLNPQLDEFDWTPWITEPATLDFELHFWNNLSEHPALVGTDTDAAASGSRLTHSPMPPGVLDPAA